MRYHIKYIFSDAAYSIFFTTSLVCYNRTNPRICQYVSEISTRVTRLVSNVHFQSVQFSKRAEYFECYSILMQQYTVSSVCVFTIYFVSIAYSHEKHVVDLLIIYVVFKMHTAAI